MVLKVVGNLEILNKGDIERQCSENLIGRYRALIKA